MRGSDLNPHVNHNAVTVFVEHAEFICCHQRKLFDGFMSDHGHNITTSYVRSYCNQVRNLFKKVKWLETSINMEGIFDKNFELLEMI